MTPRARTPFGAAPARPRLQPLKAPVPAAVVHPDEAYEENRDCLSEQYEADQRRDRLQDYTPVVVAPADVVALPARERLAERRAA